MAKEIERKFLVRKGMFDTASSEGETIIQAYLSDKPEATVRIRIKGTSAFLTVKSRNHGISRDEWEYGIPVDDAIEMIDKCACELKIEKTRYRFGKWEIDEFHGRHDGLVLAEIELSSPEEPIDIPGFIGREVTGDPRYYNSVLCFSSVLPPID